MKQRTKVMLDDSALSRQRYSDEDSQCEDVPLRSRVVEHCMEAEVQEGDTLQAIALRFHCQISELKRINHMHKDNEIFARRTIKVPITPYSILTEVLPAPEQAPSTSKESPKTDHVIDYNAAILNSTIAPAVVPYTDNVESINSSENTLLIQPVKKDCVEAVVVKELTSHGADFGIKWFHLLTCILVLGFIIPIVYVLFYLDKHTDIHAMHVPSHPPH